MRFSPLDDAGKDLALYSLAAPQSVRDLAEVLACMLEDCQVPQAHLFCVSVRDLEEQSPPLGGEHPQEAGGALAGLVGSLDVFPLGGQVDGVGAVESVCGHVLLEISVQRVVCVTENEDVIDAVRRFMANAYAVQGFEHRCPRAPPSVRFPPKTLS